MAYKEIIANYPPYMAASDRRGFISKYYGNGHSGVDSVGNLYTMPVCAVFDGKIACAQVTAATGNSITYQSDNGRVKVQYLHLRDKPVIKAGDKVKKNQAIAYEGSTGSLSTGKHLHISLWIDGKLCDPLPYLKGDKKLPLEMKKEETKMKYKVGDSVKVKGKIAPSAYSTAGTVTRDGELKITKIYEGANFPYQLGVVGFTRDADIETAGNTVSKSDYDQLKKENEELKNKIAKAQSALK